MTSLRENIKKSLDDNLKKRDDIATATLRLILAAIKDSDIENRTKKRGDTISDQQILLLLQNMVSLLCSLRMLSFFVHALILF